MKQRESREESLVAVKIMERSSKAEYIEHEARVLESI